jgi:hypothetical protein
LPEPGNFVVDGPVGGGLVYGAAKFIGQCESVAHLVLDCASKIRIFEQAIAEAENLQRETQAYREVAVRLRPGTGFSE